MNIGNDHERRAAGPFAAHMLLPELRKSLDSPVDVAFRQRLRSGFHLHVDVSVGKSDFDIFVGFDDDGRGARARS
ncbi:hypothetical protein Y023_5243 [Burkholderia pseudomallei A79D]|nr:hypothetical protein Y023_5243 [Burkholderia pseudomallei A79D]KGX96903.1 hypothetical protein X997_4923 [Burkholderia pseudomallei A79C]